MKLWQNNSMESHRMRREKRTIAAMVRMYCRHFYGGERLCSQCSVLLDYAEERLKKCQFQQNKPVCVKCRVHCYRTEMRERVRAVMRYAGPKMIYHHPWLSVMHLMDKYFRKRGV